MGQKLTVLAVAALVSACSSGSGSSGNGSGGQPGGTPAQPNIFGLEKEARISVATTSAQVDTAAITSAQNGDQFWVKAHGPDRRAFRYGRPGSGTSATGTVVRHNYQIPLSLATRNGITVNTGSLTVTDATSTDIPNSGERRAFTFTEIEHSDAIAGVLLVEECCRPGNFTDAHAYAGGTSATALPTQASYTGNAVLSVNNTGGASSTQARAATLSVNFGTNAITGNIGTAGNPDITLSGSVSGTTFSGTATVSSTALGMTNGAVGTFNGGVFGAQAINAAGTLGVADGANTLVGGFAMSRD